MTARRRLIAASRRLRELRSIGSALADTAHPYMAHIVPMRRCNLACTYCNEFDDFSKPVDIDEMRRRIGELGRLGTSVITISGGEPLLHPELDDVIRAIRKTGAIAGMITNGYLLMPDRIHRLNKAGLDHMQISIDNVMPDEVCKKSLKVLDAKLRMLAEHADFHVNINSVVGGGIEHPEDALTVSKRALELGFSSTIGIIHDGTGQLKPLGERERKRLGRSPPPDPPLAIRASTTSRKRSPTASPTTGVAAPARATSTSARTASSTTAASSAALPPFPSPTTPPSTSSASSSPKKAALPTAPSPACTRSATSTTGAPRRPRPPRPVVPARTTSCRFNNSPQQRKRPPLRRPSFSSVTL